MRSGAEMVNLILLWFLNFTKVTNIPYFQMIFLNFFICWCSSFTKAFLWVCLTCGPPIFILPIMYGKSELFITYWKIKIVCILYWSINGKQVKMQHIHSTLSAWVSEVGAFSYEFNILVLGVELPNSFIALKRNLYPKFHMEFEVVYM